MKTQREYEKQQCLKRLVRKIKYSLRKRETRILQQKEWEGAKAKDFESETEIVGRIADAAGCDWLIDTSTGEARFFEPT